MPQDWPYAQLSKAAKAEGGVEKFVEKVVSAARNAGKKDMLPWLGVTLAGGALIGTAITKTIDHLKSKKQQEELDAAKQELIEGIKAYDAEHDTTEKDTTEE